MDRLRIDALHEFDAILERVDGVDSPDAGDGRRFNQRHVGLAQPATHGIDVIDLDRKMRPASPGMVVFAHDTDVQFASPGKGEPHTAALERCRPGDLRQSEQQAVEPPCPRLGSRRAEHLDMMQSRQWGGHDPRRAKCSATGGCAASHLTAGFSVAIPGSSTEARQPTTAH